MSFERKTPAKLRHGSNGYLLTLQVNSDPNLLCAVRGAVERLTEAFGFSAAEGRAITRAVDEALTNIIRHAYSGASDRPIDLTFRSVPASDGKFSGEGLEITMSDHGPAVDPDKMCGRELSDIKPGGLGLHFIRQSMDIVEFQRANDTNSLRLVKYVRAAKC
jgi:anti-sigma regulatory factor (Ser/Thr protein kinase)